VALLLIFFRYTVTVNCRDNDCTVKVKELCKKFKKTVMCNSECQHQPHRQFAQAGRDSARSKCCVQRGTLGIMRYWGIIYCADVPLRNCSLTHST